MHWKLKPLTSIISNYSYAQINLFIWQSLHMLTIILKFTCYYRIKSVKYLQFGHFGFRNFWVFPESKSDSNIQEFLKWKQLISKSLKIISANMADQMQRMPCISFCRQHSLLNFFSIVQTKVAPQSPPKPPNLLLTSIRELNFKDDSWNFM